MLAKKRNRGYLITLDLFCGSGGSCAYYRIYVTGFTSKAILLPSMYDATAPTMSQSLAHPLPRLAFSKPLNINLTT
jgi:hypothetical protein